MELKTQALDRLLEALSPTLAQELDRVVQETREGLEREFQVRLRDAQLSAEKLAEDAIQRSAADARAAEEQAEALLQRSVADARESTERRVTEELEQRFRRMLEETTHRLQTEFAAERKQFEEQLHQWRVFADAQRQFAEASTQSDMLSRFLKLAAPFAAALALYVSRADGLALWKSRGDLTFPQIISEGSTDPESYFRTILVRGKVVAAVCAAPPCRMEIIDFLVSSVERAVEVFGLKLNTPTPKPVITGGTDRAYDQKAPAEARRPNVQ
jgi:hypothetical protein